MAILSEQSDQWITDDFEIGLTEAIALNNKRTNNREYEIDFFELLRELVHRWWLLLGAAVLAAALMFGYTRFFVTPLYTSTVSFYVNNGQLTDENKISNSDIIASQSLVETYIVILKYGATLDEVIYDANLDCTPSQLSSKISCAAINDTEVFQVSVTDPDPQTATRIARSIARILPNKVSEVIEGSTVRIVRDANVPTHPSSPNLKKNLVLAAAAGLVLSSVYVVLRYLLDDRIRDASRFIKEHYDFPVLAVIPDLMADTGDGYYYSSQSKGR